MSVILVFKFLIEPTSLMIIYTHTHRVDVMDLCLYIFKIAESISLISDLLMKGPGLLNLICWGS